MQMPMEKIIVHPANATQIYLYIDETWNTSG